MEKRVFVKLKGQGFVELHDGVHNYVKIVKTRKDNECFLCRGSVKKGEEALVWQSQDGPMRHYTRTYYCKQCFEVLERTPIDDLPADIQPYASLKDDGGLYVRLPEDYDLFNEEAMKKRDEMAEWLLAMRHRLSKIYGVFCNIVLQISDECLQICPELPWNTGENTNPMHQISLETP